MIPDIGLMIAVYVVTRMVQFLVRDTENIVTKVFAVIAILVTLFCTLDLLAHGSRSLPY